MSFQSPLEIREADRDFMYWSLLRPLLYQGNEEMFVAPIGFVTNFASVPRIFWSLLPPWGRHMKAAVMHDYFYRSACVSRLDADRLFYRMMKQLGVSWWRRQAMYRAVRLFGGRHYNG